jgi:non-ribosomal peptide synthetase component F
MEKVYTHVSPEHVRGQMEKRTARAFTEETQESGDESPAAPEIARLTVDQMRELADRLATEIARRGGQ